MWQSTEVALKNLKEGSGEQDKVKFLQEAAIMAQFIHPNIVTLHGVVSDEEPVSSMPQYNNYYDQHMVFDADNDLSNYSW